MLHRFIPLLLLLYSFNHIYGHFLHLSSIFYVFLSYKTLLLSNFLIEFLIRIPFLVGVRQTLSLEQQTRARQKRNVAAKTQKSHMQFYKIIKIFQLQNDRMNADTTLGHKLSATRRLPESRHAVFAPLRAQHHWSFSNHMMLDGNEKLRRGAGKCCAQ